MTNEEEAGKMITIGKANQELGIASRIRLDVVKDGKWKWTGQVARGEEKWSGKVRRLRPWVERRERERSEQLV